MFRLCICTTSRFMCSGLAGYHISLASLIGLCFYVIRERGFRIAVTFLDRPLASRYSVCENFVDRKRVNRSKVLFSARTNKAHKAQICMVCSWHHRKLALLNCVGRMSICSAAWERLIKELGMFSRHALKRCSRRTVIDSLRLCSFSRWIT